MCNDSNFNKKAQIFCNTSTFSSFFLHILFDSTVLSIFPIFFKNVKIIFYYMCLKDRNTQNIYKKFPITKHHKSVPSIRHINI